MRRAIASVGGVLLLLICAPASHGWWLFHHHHHGHAAYGAYAAQAGQAAPVGQPFTFQLPGGFGVSTTIDLQKILSDLAGAIQKPGQNPGQTSITVDPAVKTKIDSIQTQVNAGVDDLNKLTARMNAKINTLKTSSPAFFKDQAQFQALDKLQTSGTTTPVAGGPTKVDGGP